MIVFSGCKLETSKRNAVYLTTPPSPSVSTRELAVDKIDKSSFLIDHQVVKIKDEYSSVTSITHLAWINKNNIEITCHVNPSLDYFTIYNIDTKQFEYATYGTWFIWDKKDINSLVYIECPTHFANLKNREYKIVNYSGKILYRTKNQLKNLEYNNNVINFKEINADGETVSKSIS